MRAEDIFIYSSISRRREVRAEVVFLYSSLTRRREVRAEVVFLYLYYGKEAGER
jgi:hypothetical protein